MKCRVVIRTDGGISIIHPAFNSKKPNETETQWLERVFNKIMVTNKLEGRPFTDIDKSKIPKSREDRNLWEWDDTNKNIKINSTKAKVAKREKLISGEISKIQEEVYRQQAIDNLKGRGEID